VRNLRDVLLCVTVLVVLACGLLFSAASMGMAWDELVRLAQGLGAL
jgi:hypothetical protein